MSVPAPAITAGSRAQGGRRRLCRAGAPRLPRGALPRDRAQVAEDAILSENDDGIAPVDEREDGWLCFYEIVANHFVRVPESGRRILELIVQLWSQSFAANIFALLFHKWLFEAPFGAKEISPRYISALVQGATNVFWIDIQTNTRHFLSLYHYLLEDVALVPDRLSKISLQAGRDLILLLSRFMFFYDQDHLLSSFLEHFPTFPNSFFVGGPADYFVIELADQLQKLKIEPVLLHYLSRMTILQGLELRMSTSTRLKACLYSFTSPGGPTQHEQCGKQPGIHWICFSLLVATQGM